MHKDVYTLEIWQYAFIFQLVSICILNKKETKYTEENSVSYRTNCET